MNNNPLILISGEGRSGTTMLLKFLYLLGFDNGGDLEGPHEFLKGTEITPDIKWPEVIKHLGGFCKNLKYWITENNWNPQHLFYMANTIDITVNKRLFVHRKKVKISPRVNFEMTFEAWQKLTDDEKVELVKNTYYKQMGQAVYGAFELGIPTTVVHYQKFCKDIDYACQVLQPILYLKDLEVEDVRGVHKEFIDLEKVRSWDRTSKKALQ